MTLPRGVDVALVRRRKAKAALWNALYAHLAKADTFDDELRAIAAEHHLSDDDTALVRYEVAEHARRRSDFFENPPRRF